jgi:hypothetical protein
MRKADILHIPKVLYVVAFFKIFIIKKVPYLLKICYLTWNGASQNYWVFGLCPWPSIPETRECSISESGFVSVLR